MTEFLYKLFPYKSFLNPSSGDFITAWLVTIIIIYSIVSFIRLLVRLRKIRISITDQFTNLSGFSAPASEAFEDINDLFSANALLKDEWVEYDSTLIKRGEPRRVYKTEEAEVYFNEERILSHSKLNVRYWYAVPGILVGLGILGTFIGLTFGLSTFKTGDVNTIQKSIDGLLSGMTTAFATSVWGIGFSIVFNAFEKRQFNKVGIATNKLNRQIDKLFTLTTQEKIAFEQQDLLEQMKSAMQHFSTDLSNNINAIMASQLGSLQGVVQQLYQHGEQSTALVVKEIKSSGESIANNVREAVGNAMLEKMAPALEAVAKSVNDLTRVKEESSVDAIRKLVEEFRDLLSKTISGDFERLAELIAKSGGGLEEFSTRLNAMIGLLQEQVQQTKTILEQSSMQAQADVQRRSEEIDRTFSELLKRLEQGVAQQQETITQASEDAAAATARMREEAGRAAAKFGETIGELQKNVAALLERQSQNVQIVDSLIANAEDILKQGSTLANSMNVAIGTVREAIGEIQPVSQQLTDSSSVLRLSSDNLQASTARFTQQNEVYLKANRETLDRIQQSQSESQQLLREFVEKFAVIESGLSGIFEQVNQGLNSYASITREGISNYLRDFSTQLAEASKNLAGSVEALSESMEDLADILSSVKRR